MRQLKTLLTVLCVLAALEGAALAGLGLLVYQTTPASVLANQTFIGRMTGVLGSLRALGRVSNVLYWGPKPPRALPQYTLTIDPADLQELQALLPTELPSQFYGNLFLTDENKHWAKGTLTEGDDTYAVQVRVRGDLFNHWAYRKKSWRVRFEDGKPFHGMHELNLILPDDREWYAEHLTAWRAAQLGLLYPTLQFVQVDINGSGPLIYTQAEQWGPEMLTAHGRASTGNIYSAGGGRSYFQQWDPAFQEGAYWEKSTADTQNPANYADLDALLKLTKSGSHSDPAYLGKLRAIINTDSLAAWYALGALAGSHHMSDFNTRLLFNPDTKKFEVLPWDIAPSSPHSLIYLTDNALLDEAMRVPELKLQAQRMVWDYVTSKGALAADRAKAAELRGLMERAAYRDSLKIQNNRQVHAQLESIAGTIEANLRFLPEELSRSEVLVTQRKPATASTALGTHLATFDVTARGPAVAAIAEVSLPAGASRTFSLLRDTDGNGVPSAGDERIALSLSESSGATLTFAPANLEATLVWAGDPVPDAHTDELTAPHTHHLFFLLDRAGAAVLPSNVFPLPLKIRNAVTTKKAQVIAEIFVDDSRPPLP